MPTSLYRVVCGVVAGAVAAATLTGCRTGAQDAPLESLEELVARIAPERRGSVTPAAEPTSYRVEYDLYVKGHSKGDVAGSGAKRRRRLDATPLVRSVVRPFTASGAVRRTLGFVREAGGGTSRVGLVRPLPDDPRPHVYPAATPPSTYRRVAGRLCASHRIDADEYCVDSTGIVLLTRTPNSVEVVRKVAVGTETRTAQDLGAPLARGFSQRDRGSIRPVHADTSPPGATDYSLDTPPEGFSLVGRYATVPLTAELLKPDSKKVIAGLVDVYVRGADGVVVDRGGKLDQSSVGPEDLGSLVDARGVDLGPLGNGQVGIGGFGPFGYREVRVTQPGGRYVVVAGTLTEDQLIAIARSLRPRPGTELRYLDA